MTVVLAFASNENLFLAADSCRWDYVLHRNVGPVKKIHQISDGLWMAAGGSGIDRTKFAEKLRGTKSSDVMPAAKALAEQLFTENKILATKNNVTIQHFLLGWFACVDHGVPRLTRLSLPDNTGTEFQGFDCMGPDTPWLQQRLAIEIEKQRAFGNELRLDEISYSVIEAAAARHPLHVAFPAIAVVLRKDGSSVSRDDLQPGWSGSHPAFTIFHP